jgi:hypothetical protein
MPAKLHLKTKVSAKRHEISKLIYPFKRDGLNAEKGKGQMDFAI